MCTYVRMPTYTPVHTHNTLTHMKVCTKSFTHTVGKSLYNVRMCCHYSVVKIRVKGGIAWKKTGVTIFTCHHVFAPMFSQNISCCLGQWFMYYKLLGMLIQDQYITILFESIIGSHKYQQLYTYSWLLSW